MQVRVWNNLEPKFETVGQPRPSVMRRRISADPCSSSDETVTYGDKLSCEIDRINCKKIQDVSPASPSYRVSSSKLQTCEIYRHRTQEEEQKEELSTLNPHTNKFL